MLSAADATVQARFLSWCATLTATGILSAASVGGGGGRPGDATGLSEDETALTRRLASPLLLRAAGTRALSCAFDCALGDALAEAAAWKQLPRVVMPPALQRFAAVHGPPLLAQRAAVSALAARCNALAVAVALHASRGCPQAEKHLELLRRLDRRLAPALRAPPELGSGAASGARPVPGWGLKDRRAAQAWLAEVGGVAAEVAAEIAAEEATVGG